MCGINAIFALDDHAPAVDECELVRTRDAMRARGPDAAGLWISRDRRAALAHRRLSIIDPGDRANQPMHSADGRLSIVFNGEIYNYRELREPLVRDGHRFVTSSDTEVLLALHRVYGAEMLVRLRGMFAFAIWDAETRSAFVARDAYGIKPLYYAWGGGTLRVASPVKALLAGGGISHAPDLAGVAGFLLRGSVPEPYTTHAAIRALPAGSWMRVRAGNAPEGPHEYISISAILRDAVHERVELSSRERQERIAEAVSESVRYHLVSDVPVGSFLSAGRDSATIVALASEHGAELETVTVRVDEYVNTARDEAPLARVIAQQYGARHTTHTLTEAEFLAELPRVVAAMDQPTIDAMNSYFVCRAAAQLGWKVALSGTGGDELFGGYKTFRTVPRTVRACRLLRRLPFAAAAVQHAHSRFMPRGQRFSPKSGAMLTYAHSYEGAYLVKRGLFLPHELSAILGRDAAAAALNELAIVDRFREAITPDPGTPFARVAALESTFYLRNQLLRDLDWASMAHSLEVRVPLVDPFLLRTIAPLVVHGRTGEGKSMLARAPRVPLPDAVLARRKTGFTVPMKRWLEDQVGDPRHPFGMRAWALHLTRELRAAL